MAAEFSCRRTEAGTGVRFLMATDTYTTWPSIRRTRTWFMPQDSNLPPGDRAIAASTGLEFQDSISNGDIGSFLILWIETSFIYQHLAAVSGMVHYSGAMGRLISPLQSCSQE